MSLAATLRRRSVLITGAVIALVAIVWGVAAIRAAQPPTLEQRVRAIAAELQVPGGFGESAATSSSPVAEEMRDLIRQDLQQGMSEREILDYFRARYGDGILQTPPPQGFNALMWLPPVVIALSLLYIAVVVLGDWRRTQARIAPSTSNVPSTTSTVTEDDPELERLRAALYRELAEAEGLSEMREGRVR